DLPRRCADGDDSSRRGAHHRAPVAAALHRHGVALGQRSRWFLPLAAGCACQKQERRRRGERDFHATHCQSAHCATETPSSSELTATIAVWARGRPPMTARARKSGKMVRPKRGSESSGQRSLGTLSGIARLTAANSPYGAPKRRQAMTVSATKRARK